MVITMTYLFHNLEVYPHHMVVSPCLPSGVFTTYNEDVFSLNAKLLEGSGDTLANLDLVLVAGSHKNC